MIKRIAAALTMAALMVGVAVTPAAATTTYRDCYVNSVGNPWRVRVRTAVDSTGRNDPKIVDTAAPASAGGSFSAIQVQTRKGSTTVYEVGNYTSNSPVTTTKAWNVDDGWYGSSSATAGYKVFLGYVSGGVFYRKCGVSW